MFEEFHCDIKTVQELAKFNYIDERGFNWGACMQSKSDKILKLITDERQLEEARSKALKISKEILGFGNLILSPSSSASASPSSSRASITSSFGSCYSESPTLSVRNEANKGEEQQQHLPVDHKLSDLQKGSLVLLKSNSAPSTPKNRGARQRHQHLWETPVEENTTLLDETDSENEEVQESGWLAGISSRVFGNYHQHPLQKKMVDFRSLSNAGKQTIKKKMGRQLSLGL